LNKNVDKLAKLFKRIEKLASKITVLVSYNVLDNV